MIAKYTAIISRDLQKKRKKWIDGEVTIDKSTNIVKVFELSDAGDRLGRQVYSGIVEAKLLSKLTESEEVKLGSLLVCTSDLIQSIGINVAEREISTENVIAAPNAVLPRLKGIPFKSPRGFNGQPVLSKSSLVKDSTSTTCPTLDREFTPPIVVAMTPVETILSAAPSRAGCLSSMSAFSCPSSKTLERSSDSTAASSVQARPLQLFCLKRLYYLPHRMCQVNHTFRGPQQYAEQFTAATAEEIQLNLASVMSNIESRTLSALGINVDKAALLPSKLSNNSSGTASSASGMAAQLLRKPLVSKSSSPPSAEAVVAKVRSAGIPLTNRVDVIVSPVRDEEISYKSGPKKWSKGQDDSDGEDVCAGKRCKTDGENEHNATFPGADAAANDGTKLYFKVSDGKHRSCPQGVSVWGLSMESASIYCCFILPPYQAF